MRGIIDISFSQNVMRDWNASCNTAIRNVFRGTKKATIAACEEILEESLKQVPSETGALASTAYYEAKRRSDTAATTWAYEGNLGYSGDAIHPLTGKLIATYMVAVHEVLEAKHPVGKAKFLEDPVREYADNNFQRTVFKYAKESLASQSD